MTTPCQIMGIVNVTPDSFYAGSRVGDVAGAIERAEAMVAAGADIIDIGGESTRPGAKPVPHDLEISRVVPVIEVMSRVVEVSIDTRHASVARVAVAAGASIINDVSATLESVAAETGAGWVAMHMRGTPQSMQQNPTYDDVVAEVLEFVIAAGQRGRAAGVERIWIDPGIGFGKTGAHNLALIKALPRFVGAGAASGFGLLLGASRKRFIGMSHAAADTRSATGEIRDITKGEPLAANDRLEGSLTLATWAIVQNAGIVRVHDVADTVRCSQVVRENQRKLLDDGR